MSHVVVVRHYHHSSARFRSAGFTSLAPPPPETQLDTREPEHKKRKTCFRPGGVAKTLDPALWRSLPDDVFERVVSHMPLPALLRCRALNKHYEDFVFSHRFQTSRASIDSWSSLNQQHQYLLLFATINNTILCTAYDASRNLWLRLPPMQGLDPRAKLCIAGDGGLLCFRDTAATTLFVYNPVTTACRELPPMHATTKHHTWILTHLIYNSFTKGYKLLVITKLRNNNNNGRAHMEIYDSGTDTWTVDKFLAVLERKYKLSFVPQVGACSDNFFYFVATEGVHRTRRSSVTGLVVYDVYSGAFRGKLLYRCEPRGGPDGRIDVQVVECAGGVVLVVREDDSIGRTKGVSFCRLDPCKEQKVEDSVLFESFFGKWAGVFPTFRCVSVRKGLGLLLCDESLEILVDDLSDAAKLPASPLEGLRSFVHSTTTTSEAWPLGYANQNVVSDARFQPNASVSV